VPATRILAAMHSDRIPDAITVGGASFSGSGARGTTSEAGF
jgi:hypothetical protein